MTKKAENSQTTETSLVWLLAPVRVQRSRAKGYKTPEN